jgi:hypothetical protein
MVTQQLPYANSHLFTELNACSKVFTCRQIDLAQSTGFRAFSTPIHEIQFDRQFTTWLITKVDTINRSVLVSAGKRLSVFQEDAAMVLGIPSAGKEVWDASLDKSVSMRQKIEGLIGIDEKTTSPRQAAMKMLRTLAGKDLSSAEEEVFKVSFSVFVVSMLCDSTNPGDVESVNFWPALSDPGGIHQFNWASYIVDSVFSACVCARKATRTNTPYNPPSGTALFLQVRIISPINIFDTTLDDFLTLLTNRNTFCRFFTSTTWTMDHCHWIKINCLVWMLSHQKSCPNRFWLRQLAYEARRHAECSAPARQDSPATIFFIFIGRRTNYRVCKNYFF